MRPCTVLSLTNHQTGSDQTSEPISTDQCFAASVQVVASGDPAGQVSFQFSNDYPTPIHWSDLPTDPVSFLSADSLLIPRIDLAYQFVRLNYLSIGSQYIQTHADGSAIPQITNISCGEDQEGSYNNTSFFINSVHDDNEYYVWFNVDSMGTDPMVPGKTGVQVAIALNASGPAIASAIGTALDLVNAGLDFDCDAVSFTVTVTNKTAGECTDGDPNTATVDLQVFQKGLDEVPDNVLNNTYFYINRADSGGGTAYYVWFNTSGGGTNPMIPGKTGVEVAITTGSVIFDVTNLLAAALSAIAGAPFTVSQFNDGTLFVTNNDGGPFTAAEDVSCNFSIGIRDNDGLVNANVFLQGA